jgi:hypothetical protein
VTDGRDRPSADGLVSAQAGPTRRPLWQPGRRLLGRGPSLTQKGLGSFFSQWADEQC